MSFVTSVKVVESGSNRGLGGVKVALFDRDTASADDFIGTQFTDEQGEARFVYSALALVDTSGDEWPGQPLQNMRPDLYAVAYGANGEQVASTRGQTQENVMLPAITIAVDPQVALDHGLIRRKPAATAEDKRRQWARYWRERRARDRGQGADFDQCIGRVVVDMMAGVADPKNDLQKQLAGRLRKQLTNQELATVADYGKDARALFDSVIPARGHRCSSDTPPEEMVKYLFTPGGPLHGIKQALDSAAPDPETTLPPVPIAGGPFTTDVKFNKICMERFKGAIGPPLEPAVQRAMEEAMETKQLVPPSINNVLAWDPRQRNNVREGKPADRSMLVRTLDGRESWKEKTLQMNVPMDDPGCFVKQASEDGRQQLVMDVKPGHKIDLRGSGFISERATVSVVFRSWKPDLDDGRLVPADAPAGAPPDYAGAPVPGFDGTELRVFGSAEPHGFWAPGAWEADRIVIVWPDAAAAEGLYRLRLTFENDPMVTKTPTHITQRTDCTLTIDWSPVTTRDIWFAVLKPIAFRPIRVKCPSVTCLDETDPERFGPFDYFDDVVVSRAGVIQRVNPDANAMEGQPVDGSLIDHNIEGETVATSGPKEDEHWFWSAPAVWGVPDADIFPKAGEGLPTLGRFDFMTITLAALEIEGPADRALLSLMVIAFIAALLIVLIALIVAAVVVAVVFYCLGWLSYGIAWIILGIIEAVIATFGVFIVGLLAGAMGALLAIVAAIPPGDVIANVATVFTGGEIAHRCSQIRFHRALWLHDRPPAVSSLPGLVHETLQYDTNGVREAYTCPNASQGSRYKLELEISFT